MVDPPEPGALPGTPAGTEASPSHEPATSSTEPGAAGTEARNARLIEQYWQRIWNEGSDDAVAELYHPDCDTGSPFSIEGFQANVRRTLAAFEGFRVVLLGLFAAGDRVVTRVRYQGTQRAPYLGLAARGGVMDVSGLDVFRIEDGKIREHWHEADHLEMVEQLGARLVQPPAAAGALPLARHAGRPTLLGHRGAPLHARENTIASFQVALHAGLDGIETDVQRTADGVLVLHHDAALGDGARIAGLDAGALRRRAPQVPRLDELLPLLAAFPQAVANLELKTAAPSDDARPEELAAALQRWPADVRRRVWVSSFDPLALLRLRQADVALGFLVAHESALALVPCLPIAAVHPHARLIDAPRLASWREAGLRVAAWTVNDEATARRLVDLGVDVLIGDDPALLRAAANGS